MFAITILQDGDDFILQRVFYVMHACLSCHQLWTKHIYAYSKYMPGYTEKKCTHIHTCLHSHTTNMHKHTHTHISRSRPFSLFLSPFISLFYVCLSVCVCLSFSCSISISLSHTHTRTYIHRNTPYTYT